MKLWIRKVGEANAELQEIDVAGTKPTFEQIYQALKVLPGERCGWHCEDDTIWPEPDPELPLAVALPYLKGDGSTPATAISVWVPLEDDASSDESASTSSAETRQVVDCVWLAPHGDASQTSGWPLNHGKLKVNGSHGLAGWLGPFTTAVVVEGVELEPDAVTGDAPFNINAFGGLGMDPSLPLRVYPKGPIVTMMRKLSDWVLPQKVPPVEKKE